MTTVRDLIKDVLQSNQSMEGVVNLVAEWFSHGEMVKLQGVSVLISVVLREWQCKDTLDEIEAPVWCNLAEGWAVYMYEEGESPAL